MQLYQLDYVLHEPCENQRWLYMAEIQPLPGCRAWAETARETLSELPRWQSSLSFPARTGASLCRGDSNVPNRSGQDFRSRMTYREPTGKLRRPGCAFDRQAGGSHEIWINPVNNREITVPRHSNRDLATRTVHGIRRDLGIGSQDFDRD